MIDEYQLRYYRVDMPGEQYVIFSDISSETATLNHLKKNCILIWTVSFALFFPGPASGCPDGRPGR